MHVSHNVLNLQFTSKAIQVCSQTVKQLISKHVRMSYKVYGVHKLEDKVKSI